MLFHSANLEIRGTEKGLLKAEVESVVVTVATSHVIGIVQLATKSAIRVGNLDILLFVVKQRNAMMHLKTFRKGKPPGAEDIKCQKIQL